MKPLVKGLLLAALQLAIVLSLAGKMLYDRATRPRVWVKTAPVDPYLPIRGRYVRLRLEVLGKDLLEKGQEWSEGNVELRVENDQLVAVRSEKDTGNRVVPLRRRFMAQGPPPATQQTPFDTERPQLLEPVAFFIPEHIVDPSRRAQGEELWVEVTVPKKGPPRPIRLGVKKDGKLTPLEIN